MESCHVNINFSSACNFQCFYCNSGSREWDKKYLPPINIEDLNNILNKLNDNFFNKSIVISGGEPTLFPDLLSFAIKKISSFKNYKIRLNSNLYVENPMWLKKLYYEHKFDLLVSFPSINPNEFTQTNGLCEEKQNIILNNIIDFNIINNMSINIVLTEINKNSIFKTVDHLKNIGVKNIIVSKMLPFDKIKTPQYQVPLDEYNRIYDQLNEKYMDIKKSQSCMPMCQGNMRTLCTYDNQQNFVIYSNGDIAACSCKSAQIIGNIFLNSIDEIKQYKHTWLENIKMPFEKCKTCNFWKTHCYGGCLK